MAFQNRSMSLKERIEDVLRTSGLTKAELSRAAGVTDAAVSHWLSGGTAGLRGAVAAKLEAATGFRAVWLSTGKGERLVAPSEQGDMLLPKEVELILALRELSEEDQATYIHQIAEAAKRERAAVDRALAAMGIQRPKRPKPSRLPPIAKP